MATPEERLKILKMIQNGKITAEQGARLLDALNALPTSESTFPEVPTEKTPLRPYPTARHFRLVITRRDNGKTLVDLRLPVRLARAGRKMGARFYPETGEIDLEQLEQIIEAGQTGKVVDIDKDDGRHIEVFLE